MNRGETNWFGLNLVELDKNWSNGLHWSELGCTGLNWVKGGDLGLIGGLIRVNWV